MKLLRLHTVRLMLTALMVLSATTSCYNYSGDDDLDLMDVGTAANYINITVSVSDGLTPDASRRLTRGTPLGGEYGDGIEKGTDAENRVNTITLIFFRDGAGVNTTSDATEVECVKTYAVTAVTPVTGYHEHKDSETADVNDNEVVYTTGDQRLEETTLEVGQTYQVIVVANASMTVNVGDKIKAVRDKLYTADLYTTEGGTATNFVMSSENDGATISLTNPVKYTSAGDNRFVYYSNCIHIERMAARIDFWAKNANGYKTSTDDPLYTTPGYEYTVKKADGTDGSDRFVLTRITPFNLNNGNEYLLKRTNDGTNPYLHDETTTNWVTDPYTSAKNGTAHPDYLVSKLADVVTTFENGYTVAMAAKHAGATAISGSENVTLCYTKENTLQTDGTTPLYYYATGLAFEGYYYAAGETTGSRRIYYYFIRHQGEGIAAYSAWTTDNIDDAKTTLCPASPAMNYGIVRNNIYRISIDQITEDARIKVKMWDKFTHSRIYM